MVMHPSATYLAAATIEYNARCVQAGAIFLGHMLEGAYLFWFGKRLSVEEKLPNYVKKIGNVYYLS